jgi:hypothetical protein
MLKVNSDPDCPGSDIHKGESLTNWDTVHKDRGKHSMASIPKDRWQEIFKPKCKCAGVDCQCNART